MPGPEQQQTIPGKILDSKSACDAVAEEWQACPLEVITECIKPFTADPLPPFEEQFKDFDTEQYESQNRVDKLKKLYDEKQAIMIAEDVQAYIDDNQPNHDAISSYLKTAIASSIYNGIPKKIIYFYLKNLLREGSAAAKRDKRDKRDIVLDYSNLTIERSDFSGSENSRHIVSIYKEFNVSLKFSQATLINTIFSNAYSDECPSDAKFDGATFINVKFEMATFRRADFRNAFFSSGTQFEYGDLSNSTFTNANFEDTTFNRTCLWEADFRNAFFSSGIQFNKVNLSNSIFTNANFEDATFNETLLCKADFTNAKFNGKTIFYGTDLQGVDFSGIEFDTVIFECSTNTFNLSNAKFIGTKFKGKEKSSFIGATLTEGIFSDVDLSGITFDCTDLRKATFRDANLSKVIFRAGIGILIHQDKECLLGDLSYVFFQHAKLDGAQFDGVTLKNAKFQNVTLIGTRFSNVDLSGVDFSGVDLSGAGFKNTNFKRAIFRGAKLCGVDFSGMDLSGVNFSGADLTGAKFIGATLTGAIFTKANLQNANLQNANMTYTCLGGADLRGADCSGANFYRAKDLGLTKCNDNTKFDKACLRVLCGKSPSKEDIYKLDAAGAIVNGGRMEQRHALYAALRGYTHGGATGRFFSLAWNRHYVTQVEDFLTTCNDEDYKSTLSQEIERLLSAISKRKPQVKFNENGALACIIKSVFTSYGSAEAKKTFDSHCVNQHAKNAACLRPSL